MKVRLFQRESGIWYIEYKRKRFSLKTNDSQEAQKLYNLCKEKIYLKKLTNKVPKIELGKFTEKLLEWICDNKSQNMLNICQKALNNLISYFGINHDVNKISSSNIPNYMYNLSYYYQPSYINNQITFLRAAFYIALSLGIIFHNPFKKVKLIDLNKYEISDLAWERIKTAHGYTCLGCGKKEPEISLTRDHIFPKSRGGKLTRKNIQPLCWSCNSKKATQYIDYREVRTDRGRLSLTSNEITIINNTFRI